MPAGLNPAESEAVIGADDPDGAGAREAAQSLVPEIAGDTDDRDWRSRSALPEAPPGSVVPLDAPRRPPMEPSAKVPKALACHLSQILRVGPTRTKSCHRLVVSRSVCPSSLATNSCSNPAPPCLPCPKEACLPTQCRFP
jgi:hypothetical protein